MRKFNLTAFFMILLCAAVSGMVSGCGKQEDSSAEGRLELLNVSYDPTREFYADYILPYAFDPRVKDAVAKATAEAARKDGVARI